MRAPLLSTLRVREDEGACVRDVGVCADRTLTASDSESGIAGTS